MLDDIYHMLKFLTDENITIEAEDLLAFWKLAAIGLQSGKEGMIA